MRDINRIALMGSKDVIAVKLADLEHNMDITRVNGDDRDKIMNLINTRYKPAYDILSKKFKARSARE